MVEKTKGIKPRNKSKDDIPFPVVYFGFIFAFLAFRGQRLWERLLPWEDHMNSLFIADFEAAKLPLFSFFVVCPALYLWRSFVKKYGFAPWAQHWAGLEPGSTKFEKFCEQAWLAAHYTLATSLGYIALRDKPWWPPVVDRDAQLAIMATLPEREADQQSTVFRMLYSLQLGFYTLELLTLLFTKQRRSDAVMYFFHHIYTIFLMGGSWLSYQHRVGSLVLFLHDIGDIFLPIGKCYTYAEEYIRTTKTKAQYKLHKTIGMMFFVLFVIGFAVPRLILYGALVYQGFDEFHWHGCCGINVETDYCGKCRMGPMWGTLLTGTLGLLYPMHVYWFYLIVKMAAQLILAPGDYDDVRSDDEKAD